MFFQISKQKENLIQYAHQWERLSRYTKKGKSANDVEIYLEKISRKPDIIAL